MLYELGFHIVPSVAEEKLVEEVSAIKSALQSAGGTFVSEEFPKLRPLAYEISKKIGPVKHTYDKAYFGWIKFECEAAEIPALNKAFTADEKILRFLLIHTTKESSMPISKMPRGKDSDTAGEEGESAPVSEAELDKSIDALIS